MDATPIKTISPIGNSGASARVGLTREKAITGQRPKVPPVEDTVELSPAAIAVSREDVQFSLRTAWISDVRAQIKAGTFLTAERMDGTAERLLNILGQASSMET